MSITPNQWTILEALQSGARWARSFQTVKPLLNDLVEQGLVERCRPHLGRAKNQVRLTVAGGQKLGLTDSELITTALPPALPLHRAKSWDIGTIRDGATDMIRATCEGFLRATRSGTEVPDAVAEIAAGAGVQHPAIWRRLRAGGVLSPLKKRGGGHRAQRRTTAAERFATFEATRPAVVDRDPCPRCGIRGDIGCAHSRNRLGMML